LFVGSAGISPPVSLGQPREEPEKIKKWRQEQVKRLEEKGKCGVTFIVLIE